MRRRCEIHAKWRRKKSTIRPSGAEFQVAFHRRYKQDSDPRQIKGTQSQAYDVTWDPNNHVSNFQWAIKMIPMDSKLWRLYYVGTLNESARYRLASLPLRSIESFKELCTKFYNSFNTPTEISVARSCYIRLPTKRGGIQQI